jgi:alpha-1,2-mannosyltransferase
VTASSVSVHGPAASPGLRTFRSRRFREVIAATLLVVGVAVLGMALARQAADPRGQFAIDFADYQVAAQRIAVGESPYAAAMLAGPVDAQGQDRFRYPPVSAQLLVPFAVLPLVAAAGIWLVMQAACLLAAVWLAGSLGGASRSRERVLWSGVAATWFLPVFDTLWKGNVSGIVALAVTLVAFGGAASATSAVAATVLKLAPAALLPAALIAGGRRAWFATGATVIAVIGVSVALSPGAWADYAVVLPNLLAGSADYSTNLAPAALAESSGWPGGAVDALRLAALGAAAVAVVLSATVARRRGGLPAATILGAVAMLLLPAALWYHYLCVLLPIAALAWPAAGPRLRAVLALGAALVSSAVAWLPLALVGATVIIAAALHALWPRRPAAAT